MILHFSSVIAVAYVIAVIGCMNKLLLQIRTLDGAKHQVVIKGEDHLQLRICHLPRRKVVGTARGQESAAQDDIIFRSKSLHTRFEVQVCHDLAQFRGVTLHSISAQHLAAHRNLILILIQQVIHDGVIRHVFVHRRSDKLRRLHLALPVGKVDHRLRMAQAPVVAAALQVVNAFAVLQNIVFMGMSLKNDIHITVRQHRIIVSPQLGIRNIAGRRRRASMSVMDGIHDKISAVFPQFLCFRLDKLRQNAACLEVKTAGYLLGNGGIAVTNSADNADLGTAALHYNGRLAVFRLLIRVSIIDVDGKERKLRHCGILRNEFLAPIILMIAQSHGDHVQIVHPVRDDLALGQIGFRAALPHIAGRQQNHMLIVLIGAFEECGQFIHTGLGRRIRKFTVQIVECEQIQHNGNRYIAAVAKAVVIGVGVRIRRTADGGGGCLDVTFRMASTQEGSQQGNN